jgi:hypothetical protein
MSTPRNTRAGVRAPPGMGPNGIAENVRVSLLSGYASASRAASVPSCVFTASRSEPEATSPSAQCQLARRSSPSAAIDG